MNRRDRLMTIGTLAARAGVAASTIRFYESEGLLAPVSRSPSGYRLYGSDELERLLLIRAAQRIGFTLEDIHTLLVLMDQPHAACRAQVRRLLETRLAAVEAKLQELKRVRVILGRALARCRRSDGGCAVLEALRPTREGAAR